MYGKLTDAGLTQAPNPLLYNSRIIYNPSDALYAEAGYLPVIDTVPPEQLEGEIKHYASHWEEQDGEIVKVWVEVDPPIEEEPKIVETPVVELTAAQKRELAYNTDPVIEWDGEFLTVTQAAQQWAYYAAEGDTEKTEALTALIAAAKANIRAQYPDTTT